MTPPNLKVFMDNGPNSFQMLDCNGRKIEAPINGVDIIIRPGSAKMVVHVDFPEFEMAIDTDDVTLVRNCRLVAPSTPSE